MDHEMEILNSSKNLIIESLTNDWLDRVDSFLKKTIWDKRFNIWTKSKSIIFSTF